MNKTNKWLIRFILAILITLGVSGAAWAGTWQSTGGPGGPVAVAPDGTVWAASGNYVYHYSGGTWSQISSAVPGDRGISEIAVDKTGKVWVVSEHHSDSDHTNYGSVYNLSGSSWAYVGGYFCNLTVAADGTIFVTADTKNGTGPIYKYNGYSFDVSYSISGASLSALSDGSVWIASSSGSIAYWKSGTWYSAGSLSYPNYGAFTTRDDGRIEFISSTGIYYWNNGSWVQESASGESVNSVITGPGNTYWGSCSGSLMCWDGVGWHSIGSAGYWRLAMTADGRIWTSGSTTYTMSGFSLTPSPNGPTGQMVVSPKVDAGIAANYGNIQVSTDGTNFSTLYTANNGSTYTYTPTLNSYWFRLPWKRTDSFAPYSKHDCYTNIFNVPTITTKPNVNIAKGVQTWSASRGYSWVNMSWAQPTNTSGINLGIFDGNVYRVKDLGNVTSWDSRTAKIYPFPSGLPENNTISSDPFRWDASGTDFEDTAVRLYRSTVGTSYDTTAGFYFHVSAYNQWMESLQNGQNIVMSNATDTAPPSGTISVLSTDGLTKTSTQNVLVTVTASDTQSGLKGIQLSNDGASWGPLIQPGANMSWTLTPGAGTKTVYCKLTDNVGNTTTITGSIALSDDMLPPSVTVSLSNGATSTTTNNVTLLIDASDNVSLPGQMQMSFSNNGSIWSPWEPFQQTKSWNICNAAYGGTAGAGIKIVYVRVCDLAQNISRAYLQIGYNPNPPTNTVAVSNGVSGQYNGKSVIFVGSDMPTINVSAPGATQIRYDPGSGIWTDWQSYSNSQDIVLSKDSGLCKVRIQVQDAYGVVSTPTEILVLVDKTSPVPSLKTVSGAMATSGSSINAVLDITDPDSATFSYSLNGTTYSAVPANKVISLPVSSAGPNMLTVWVKDQAGNVGTTSILIRKL